MKAAQHKQVHSHSFAHSLLHSRLYSRLYSRLHSPTLCLALTQRAVCLPAGGLEIHNSFTPHASTPNTSKHRSRRVIILRYQHRSEPVVGTCYAPSSLLCLRKPVFLRVQHLELQLWLFRCCCCCCCCCCFSLPFVRLLASLACFTSVFSCLFGFSTTSPLHAAFRPQHLSLPFAAFRCLYLLFLSFFSVHFFARIHQVGPLCTGERAGQCRSKTFSSLCLPST